MFVNMPEFINITFTPCVMQLLDKLKEVEYFAIMTESALSIAFLDILEKIKSKKISPNLKKNTKDKSTLFLYFQAPCPSSK